MANKKVHPLILFLLVLLLVGGAFLLVEYYKQHTLAVYDNIDRTSKSAIIHSKSSGVVAGTSTNQPLAIASQAVPSPPNPSRRAPPKTPPNSQPVTSSPQAVSTNSPQVPTSDTTASSSSPSPPAEEPRREPRHKRDEPGSPICAFGFCIPM